MTGKPTVGAATGGHLTDEALVELVTTTDADRAPGGSAHLASCSSCRERLAALRRVVVALEADQPGDEVAVPDGAWTAIADELGVEHRGEHRGEHAPEPPRRPAQASPSPAAPAAPAAPRRRRAVGPAPWMLAAAAAGGLLLGWVGAQGVPGPTPAPPAGNPPATSTGPSPTVLASARLDPLPDGGAPDGEAPVSGNGRAEMDQLAGSRELVVEVEGLDVPGGATAPGGNGGYHEVWLVDVPEGRLVSLGVLGAGGGSFTVPDDVDTSAFSTVDVSWEPLDGEPGHSGASVLRGTLAPET